MSEYESKKVVMSEQEIDQTLLKICEEIKNKENQSKIAFVGIKTRGEFISKRLKQKYEELYNEKVLQGTMDITLYRDDFDNLGNLTIGETDILFNVEGKRIILIDDVLYTGRTVRAALDQLTDYGRPAKIELVVLVSREGRELPICADYIGLEIELEKGEYVKVLLDEIDKINEVITYKKLN